MFDVNKTIMRCLVKNLAMFGLGLYIYAGEDLPEGDADEQPQAQAASPKQDTAKNAQNAQKATEAPQTVNNPPKTETPGKSAVERVQSFVIKSRMKAESILTVCKHYGVNTIGELTEEQAQDYIKQASAKGVEI